MAGRGKFDSFHLALFYGHWIHCGPFGIGYTTLNGLGPLAECLNNPDPSVSHTAARSDPGSTSLSNGSMMRISPLAVWARNLSIEELERCVEVDVSMMHSKQDMWNICTAYCLAIKTLINNVEDPNRASLAIEAIREYSMRPGKT